MAESDLRTRAVFDANVKFAQRPAQHPHNLLVGTQQQRLQFHDTAFGLPRFRGAERATANVSSCQRRINKTLTQEVTAVTRFGREELAELFIGICLQRIASLKRESAALLAQSLGVKTGRFVPIWVDQR